MVAIPSRCRDCGLEFQNNAVWVSNSTDVTFVDVKTNCPQCGGVADMLTGRFNVVDEGIEMLAGPHWSWDLVDRLGLTLRRIVEEKPDDPIAEIAKTDEALADEVAKAVDAMQARRPRTSRKRLALKVVGSLVATVFTGTAAGVAAAEVDHRLHPDPEQVHQHVRNHLHHIQQTGRLPLGRRRQNPSPNP